MQCREGAMDSLSMWNREEFDDEEEEEAPRGDYYTVSLTRKTKAFRINC